MSKNKNKNDNKSTSAKAADRDFRGKEHSIRSQSDAKAPDGISGDF